MPAPESAMAAKRNDVSVKLDVEAYRKLRTVAGWKNLHVNELLSEIVMAYADRELAKLAREVARGQEDE